MNKTIAQIFVPQGFEEWMEKHKNDILTIPLTRDEWILIMLQISVNRLHLIATFDQEVRNHVRMREEIVPKQTEKEIEKTKDYIKEIEVVHNKIDKIVKDKWHIE